MVPPLRDGDGPSATAAASTPSSPSFSASAPGFATRDPPPPLRTDDDGAAPSVAFSHVHLYADAVQDVKEYKALEARLNELAARIERSRGGGANDAANGGGLEVPKCRSIWKSICGDSSFSVSDAADDEGDEAFAPQNRDVVRQLLSGFGFRVTGLRYGGDTRSVLVTSRDPGGLQFVVTAKEDANGNLRPPGEEGAAKDEYLHFDAANLDAFFASHSGRQGVAVLSFEVTAGSIRSVHSKYAKLHPKLIPPEYKLGPRSYGSGADDAGGTTEVLEVYAYYQGEKRASDADVGTRLRFVQKVEAGGGSSGSGGKMSCILPGLEPVDAEFENGSRAAYCDHWVSNVVSRTGFLDTLEDTLGFSPKVDFNAGVVAAGEAQIESTVTGNDAPLVGAAATAAGEESEGALRDRRQVYLPINNALSEVGHVHGFLREIGQGVQHVASRVDDLPSFVQRGNDMREITGEGFTFLRIPRSYYGVLTAEMLERGGSGDTARNNGGEAPAPLLSTSCAAAILETLEGSGIAAPGGAVDLNIKAEQVGSVLNERLPREHKEEYSAKRECVIETVLRSRYANLRKLLGDHLSDESYLAIVRNQILVDVQGEDLLFQIFTCNVLQRNAGDEAPFLEFIQRVCSQCLGPDGCPLPVKPGCGGFGIRNFLTLFLSIEVSKAMREVSRAKDAGDEPARSLAQRKVDLFTDQLNESNPILTEISDAMTEEGRAEAGLSASRSRGGQDQDKDEEELWRGRMDAAGRAKAQGNRRLMECSAKYNRLMRELREGGY